MPPSGCSPVNSKTSACVALRYDHSGTGDSASGPKEQGWIADWCAGVHRAVELVRATGCRDVVVVGMRIGAAVAALEASELAPLRGLVLWDPVVSGRRFLREQQVLGSVAAGEADVATTGEFVEGPGVVLPKELGAKLDWLDGPPLSGTDRLLVLTRNGRMLKRLEKWSHGTEMELSEAKGQTDLLQIASPLYLTPHETIAFIAGWIDRMAPLAAVSVSAVGERSSVVDRPRGSTIIEEAIPLRPWSLRHGDPSRRQDTRPRRGLRERGDRPSHRARPAVGGPVPYPGRYRHPFAAHGPQRTR